MNFNLLSNAGQKSVGYVNGVGGATTPKCGLISIPAFLLYSVHISVIIIHVKTHHYIA